MTKQDVCEIIDQLWVTKAHRDNLKYKIRARVYTPDDLIEWGGHFQRALDMQDELVKIHAPGAATAPALERLRDEFSGGVLLRKRRFLAAKILRDTILEEQGLRVPADLSRDAVDPHLSERVI